MRNLPTKRCLAAALVAAAGTCWAALGEPVPPPGAGVAATTSGTGVGERYTVLTRRLDSGTEVREFADTAGIVFAVSWKGPFMPDLRSLLGPHFAAYEQHASQVGRASAVSLRSDELVVQSGGRMGAFRGRAWLPRQLPAGLDPLALP